MRIAATMAFVVAWISFAYKAYPLSRTTDRLETGVLRPLSVSFLIVAISAGISQEWLLAAAAVVAWQLVGTIGAALHSGSTFSELADPQIDQLPRGQRAPLSPSESRQVAGATLKAGCLAGLVLLVALYRYSGHWYVVVPGVIVGVWLFVALATFGVAFQRSSKKAAG